MAVRQASRSALAQLMATVLDGRNEHIGGGVREALGRAPTDFRDYVRSAAAAGAWDLANLGASS